MVDRLLYSDEVKSHMGSITILIFCALCFKQFLSSVTLNAAIIFANQSIFNFIQKSMYSGD
jgi:hypothetical protein